VLDRVFRKIRIGLVGRRGPLPKPHLQALKGDRRSAASHPRPVAAEPPKPEDLGPVASKTWDAVVPELVRLGLVGRLDGPMVELFCTSFERWRAHPGGPGYASLTAAVAHAARDLGLGSGARQRMTAPAADRDELDRSIFSTDP
jgi:phage terminase small subunit